MTRFWLGLLIGLFLCVNAVSQLNSGQEHAKEAVSTLPDHNLLRLLVDSGKFGDGIEKPWQAEMHSFGVKAAAVEVHMVWFFGPRLLTPVRVIYSHSYDGNQQITDSATLEKIRASGLESRLKAEALQLAPNAHWVDLPYPIFLPFRAATAVTIWDDPWLPTQPSMFTTFGPGRPPLIAAVGFGDLADIDRLLASGSIHAKEINEALWYACGDRDPAVLLRLIQGGADVNQLRPKGEFRTCLMSAVWSNSTDAVRVLLTAGAKVNGVQGENGETPLLLAASTGAQSTEIMRLLLDSGAELHTSNAYGITALMKTANHKPEPTTALSLLIERGADINAKDRVGRTALSFAKERDNQAAVELLRAAGAKD